MVGSPNCWGRKAAKPVPHTYDPELGINAMDLALHGILCVDYGGQSVVEGSTFGDEKRSPLYGHKGCGFSTLRNRKSVLQGTHF